MCSSVLNFKNNEFNLNQSDLPPNHKKKQYCLIYFIQIVLSVRSLTTSSPVAYAFIFVSLFVCFIGARVKQYSSIFYSVRLSLKVAHVSHHQTTATYVIFVLLLFYLGFHCF